MEVTFTQCTFEGASQAIYVDSYNNSVDRCSFMFNSCGMYSWTGNAIVTGSNFYNNPDYGLFIGGTGDISTTAYQNGSIFTPTSITGSTYGVYLYDNADSYLHCTQVDNNTYGTMSYNYG